MASHPAEQIELAERFELAVHGMAAGDVVAALGSDERRGLGEEEARRRLEVHGRNELAAAKPKPAWKRLLAQLKDVLVLLLLAAAAISAAIWLVERETNVPYEALDAELELGGDVTARIVSFTLRSPLATGRLTGTLGRGPSLAESPLDLALDITASEQIRDSLAAQGVRLGRDGTQVSLPRGSGAIAVSRR